jgi:archaemetzincin
MDKIIILFISEIDDSLVRALKQHLEQLFNHPVDTRNKTRSLEYAYDADRKQYKSPKILSRLQRLKRDPEDKIMGVVDVDLYAPGYEFVYGEAKISSGVATLSMYRLHPKGSPKQSQLKVFRERVIREALHEIGHLYGLGHCKRSRCIMRACTSLTEVDQAGNKFCLKCTEALKTNFFATKVSFSNFPVSKTKEVK